LRAFGGPRFSKRQKDGGVHVPQPAALPFIYLILAYTLCPIKTRDFAHMSMLKKPRLPGFAFYQQPRQTGGRQP
jgi:hypothetical protein